MHSWPRSEATPARNHSRRGRSCACAETARHYQGRLDDQRARTPDGRTGGGTISPSRMATRPPRRRRAVRIVCHTSPPVLWSDRISTWGGRDATVHHGHTGDRGVRGCKYSGDGERGHHVASTLL